MATLRQYGSTAGVNKMIGHIAVATCLLLVLSAGCEEDGHNVRYVNQTDIAVDVFVGNGELEHVLTLQPGETKTSGELTSLWPGRVVAHRGDGSTIFSEQVTWEELRQRDFTVVIVDGSR